MMILFVIIVFEIASSDQTIKFINASEAIYSPAEINDYITKLEADYEGILKDCTGFSQVICYNNNDTVGFNGNSIKILILGGFYTHPYAPILLLRFAENFARDNFDELKDMIEIHIWPLVNEGGYNQMINNKDNDEIKTNYVPYDGCSTGINIDRGFGYKTPVNNECNTEFNGGSEYLAYENYKLRDLWLAYNYTFVFNYQGHENGLVIPYAFSDKDLSKEDKYVYKKLLGTSAKSYNDYYDIDAEGTFIDTAYDEGMYPVYVNLGNPTKFSRTMDLDYKYKELKGYILNGVSKPVGTIMSVQERSNSSEIVVKYQFLNLLPSSCETLFGMLFYFGLNDNFEYKMCEVVTQPEFNNEDSKRKCDATPSPMTGIKTILGLKYKGIFIDYRHIMMKYTNYTFEFYFTREEKKNLTIHIDANISSGYEGLRFYTISHNNSFDIMSYVEEPTTAPRWAIGVIMLGIFLLIVFAIVSCVMIRKKPGSLL